MDVCLLLKSHVAPYMSCLLPLSPKASRPGLWRTRTRSERGLRSLHEHCASKLRWEHYMSSAIRWIADKILCSSSASFLLHQHTSCIFPKQYLIVPWLGSSVEDYHMFSWICVPPQIHTLPLFQNHWGRWYDDFWSCATNYARTPGMIVAFRSHKSLMMRFRNRPAITTMTSASAACIKAPPSLIAFFILYSKLLLAFLKLIRERFIASLAL